MIPSVNGDGGKSITLRKMIHPLLPKSGAAVKKTGASYFALFGPLQDVQSRLILATGVLLALAAGAPLPIIGVIFARIIDAFPPSEAEVRTRIYQLLAVGGFIQIQSQFGNADFHSDCLFRCHVGMGLLLGYCRCSNFQRPTYSDGLPGPRT